MPPNDRIRIDFVCVHNAGRSQMAAAFAQRERTERELDEVVEIHSGGTDPADVIHEEVREAMAEVGLDVADRTPTYVADLDQLEESDYLVTMGCSIAKFNPARYGVESRNWNLTNPDGQDMETVREVRDDIKARVESLFDEVERVADEKENNTDASGSIVGSIRDTFSL